MNDNLSSPQKARKTFSPAFAGRMKKTPKSFIREILKVTESPDIISFAGGLPSPALIDVEGIARAAGKVLPDEGKTALQYSTTEGYLPLRQIIADRYKQRLGISVSPDEILITNGSQQCLDLIGKVFLNAGDHVAIERPGYLGAIQAFSLYEPVFDPVDLRPEGPDPAGLQSVLAKNPVKLFYGVPNSQNPSGITWSEDRRRELASLFSDAGTIVVEDDAYGELQFSGNAPSPMWKLMDGQSILTGSFSKILAPGMRLGWICAPSGIMEQLVIAKQASDLHSNYLSQRIAAQYLADTDIDTHIKKIQVTYRKQCQLMTSMMQAAFPESAHWTEPEGGMFVWTTLPEGCPAMKVFELALKEKVAVLPGVPFYVDGGGSNTLRLNFSNSRDEQIVSGVERLGRVIRELTG